MRFPWQRRADTEHGHRVAAERRLEDTRADWPRVRRTADALRHDKDLNGWTERMKAIISAPPEQRAGP